MAQSLGDLPELTDGYEPAQIAAENSLPPDRFFDDPETLLWHFAMNSRSPDVDGLLIPKKYWLLYARTLRRLLRKPA